MKLRTTGTIALLSAIVAVTLLACADDHPLGPKPVPQVVAFPAPMAAANGDAPDNLNINFETRSASNGSTQTPSTFGFRLKYAAVYQVTVYDYMKQVPFNPNAGLQVSDPVAMSGSFSWGWATGYTSVAFSDPAYGAGPVSFYVGFNTGDTIGTVSRTGINPINLSA